MNQFTHFVVHHSGASRMQSVETIRRIHIEERHFSDIAYHWVIDGRAKLHVGRQIPTTGSHAPPNSTRLGCMVTGDNTKSGQGWTPEQVAMLQQVWAAVSLLMPWVALAGHSELMRPGYTECPGLDVRALLLGPNAPESAIV